MATIYLNKFIGSKEIYLIWVCAISFFTTGTTMILPVVAVKTFGQKNFNAIFGLISVSVVSFIFLLRLYSYFLLKNNKIKLKVPGSFINGYIGSIYYELGWFNLSIISTGVILFGNF